MKKIQIGNTNYEVNVNYAEKGESLQKLIEVIAYHKAGRMAEQFAEQTTKLKKEQENSKNFVEDGTR